MVYKIKTKVDGSNNRYRVQLVAKGYTKEYNIDYENTFALVAKMTTVRAILCICYYEMAALSNEC